MHPLATWFPDDLEYIILEYACDNDLVTLLDAFFSWRRSLDGTRSELVWGPHRLISRVVSVYPYDQHDQHDSGVPPPYLASSFPCLFSWGHRTDTCLSLLFSGSFCHPIFDEDKWYIGAKARTNLELVNYFETCYNIADMRKNWQRVITLSWTIFEGCSNNDESKKMLFDIPSDLTWVNGNKRIPLLRGTTCSRSWSNDHYSFCPPDKLVTEYELDRTRL